MAANEKVETWLIPAVFIFRPVPFWCDLAALKSALLVSMKMTAKSGRPRIFITKAAQAARISGGRCDACGDEKHGADGARRGRAGLMLARLWFMQTVIFATSGTNALQSRMTSGVQACCCSGVPCAAAGTGAKPPTPSLGLRRWLQARMTRSSWARLCSSANLFLVLCVGLWHSPAEARGPGLGRSFGRFFVERSASFPGQLFLRQVLAAWRINTGSRSATPRPGTA